MEAVMRLYIYIFGALFLFGTLSGIYYSWRSGIEREALLEYNQKQLEQAIHDQREFKAKMQKIEEDQAAIIKRTEDEKKVFEAKINQANDYLNTEAAKKADRPASEILKQTVNKLKDAPK